MNKELSDMINSERPSIKLLTDDTDSTNS
jgi:hypothetical protein